MARKDTGDIAAGRLDAAALHLLVDDLVGIEYSYDAKQAIGRRYARMDEIGTPFCVTVDGETMESGTVTIRDRDSMQQERVDASKIEEYLQERIS